jgi:hypothetical protein
MPYHSNWVRRLWPDFLPADPRTYSPKSSGRRPKPTTTHARSDHTRSERRWSAVLLFEFAVGSRGRLRPRRLCEERMVVLWASSPRQALAAAKRYGRGAQDRYKNIDAEPVRFNFLGVLDLLHLGVECEPDEVWYNIRELLRPSERRRQLVPSDEVLLQRLSAAV